jgi:hypothetical protein
VIKLAVGIPQKESQIEKKYFSIKTEKNKYDLKLKID